MHTMLHNYIIIIHVCITVIYVVRSTFGFGRGSLPILVRYVYCRGYESSIGECTYSTTHLSDCLLYGGDIIGVQCISST